jgi:Fungal protein kinase
MDRVVKRALCVAGRATTCWKAYCKGDESKEPLVIKDLWQYPKHEEEGKLFREATEKGVINIARYYYYETVRMGGEGDDIYNNIRKALDITQASNFNPRGLMKPPSTRQSWSASISTASWKRLSSCTNVLLLASKCTCSSSPSKPRETLARWNRVHRCIIVRDYGKPIYRASSQVAMLAAVEGTIKGKRYDQCLQGTANRSRP